ncbi:MAG: VCBS domain-containing protein, partial [Desulfovibrio sp.]|uniref:VCBS domain-containing protein n=1 Tax=Desulfovibrio sp. TaxID=885 RepID=UPI002E781929
MQGFYTTYSKEEMPSFQVEGVEISGQDFFAALGEDLMPAAGPAAGSSASRGGRYNEYGGSDLLDGIDHLGRLDIGFDGATQLATDTVEPSAPEVDIDYDVTIAAGPEAGPVDLTVYEGGLAGGSQAGQAGTPTTASGSLTINAPDGVASIVIGGVVVFENGKMTGNVVTTDEGTLAVTGYDPATGKLDFSYTLDRNTTEHDKSDPATDTQISHDLTVTVTDTDGDSASTTITVNVVDDVPMIGSFSHEMSEGDAIPAVGNALSGAVAGADGAKFAWDANQHGHFGTITLNADGTYSYRLDNDNATVKELTDGEALTEEFTYTYTDADGDIAEGKVTITIHGKDNGIVIEPTDPAAGSDKVTVYESGLADGSQAGQADAPTTASGSL